MRVGVSISSTHFTDDHRVGARWMIERTRVALNSDLDSLSLGDHHSMPVPYYQGVSMLGRLMAEWTTDRPIGCLFLLPLWNPVLVAEQVGTLANLCDGPFVVQTGIGDGAGQFAAMGSSLSTRGSDLDESIRLIKGLLAGETMSSERFGLTDAAVSPRPPQPVEWWIGAGGPGPLRRAAREGDAWYAGPWATPAQMLEMTSNYREACDAEGREGRICMRKDVIVLADANRARRLGDDLIDRGYRGLGKESVAYGGIQEVIEQLAPFREAEVDELIVRCMTIDQADALETLELCGEVRRSLHHS